MAQENDITALTTLVQRMVDESGNPQDFDTRAWLGDWLLRAVPAFGGRRPLDVLKESGGLDLVRSLLLQAQTSAYA